MRQIILCRPAEYRLLPWTGCLPVPDHPFCRPLDGAQWSAVEEDQPGGIQPWPEIICALCQQWQTTSDDVYEGTLRHIADVHAPAFTTVRRIRRLSPWFDCDCRQTRRKSRLLERRYRRSRSDPDRTAWVIQVREMHTLYKQKQNAYWCRRIADNAGNSKKIVAITGEHSPTWQRRIAAHSVANSPAAVWPLRRQDQCRPWWHRPRRPSVVHTVPWKAADTVPEVHRG